MVMILMRYSVHVCGYCEFVTLHDMYSGAGYKGQSPLLYWTPKVSVKYLVLKKEHGHECASL